MTLGLPGLWTGNPGSTCEILRNTESRTPTQTSCIRIYPSQGPGDSLALGGVTHPASASPADWWRAHEHSRGAGSGPWKKWSPETPLSPESGIPWLFRHLWPSVTHFHSCIYAHSTKQQSAYFSKRLLGVRHCPWLHWGYSAEYGRPGPYLHKASVRVEENKMDRRQT